MKKITLLALTVLALAFTVNAKEVKGETSTATKSAATKIYALKGIVYDAKCNETVSGASITINGKKYYSDLSGGFSIPQLPKGKYVVTVDFISYQPQTIELDLNNNSEITIEMKQR